MDIYTQIKNPDKLLSTVRKFIDSHKITDADVIYESDMSSDLCDLMEDLCKYAGYAEVEEDDDDEDLDYLEEDSYD